MDTYAYAHTCLLSGLGLQHKTCLGFLCCKGTGRSSLAWQGRKRDKLGILFKYRASSEQMGMKCLFSLNYNQLQLVCFAC